AIGHGEAAFANGVVAPCREYDLEARSIVETCALSRSVDFRALVQDWVLDRGDLGRLRRRGGVQRPEYAAGVQYPVAAGETAPAPDLDRPGMLEMAGRNLARFVIGDGHRLGDVEFRDLQGHCPEQL